MKSSLKERSPQIPIGICKHVHEARKTRTPVKVFCGEHECWIDKTATPRSVLPKSIITDFPNASEFFPKDATTRLSIPHTRKLQCLLAQSLLYLYHPKSPWLSQLGDLASLNFSRHGTQVDFDKPYMSNNLKRSTEEHAPKMLENDEEPDIGRFMARFGLLLLQLEHRMILPLDVEDGDEESEGYETALMRHLDELESSKDFARPPESIQRIFDICCDFTERVAFFSKQGSHSDHWMNLFTIFKEIVKPLIEDFRENLSALLPSESQNIFEMSPYHPFDISDSKSQAQKNGRKTRFQEARNELEKFKEDIVHPRERKWITKRALRVFWQKRIDLTDFLESQRVTGGCQVPSPCYETLHEFSLNITDNQLDQVEPAVPFDLRRSRRPLARFETSLA